MAAVIEHIISPKFARPALVASGSAWPSTRRAARLAYRAACRHARRSTAKPRDAVHAPHGQVGPEWGRHRLRAPLGAVRGLVRTPLPSTDALGGLFALRAASQRRVSTTKALAEPLLDRCKPCLGAGVAVLDCCRPLQAPLQPSLVSIPPNTPRFRLFRLQRLHTFLTNPRVHIIYTEFHRDFIQNPIKYVQEVEIHEVSV